MRISYPAGVIIGCALLVSCGGGSNGAGGGDLSNLPSDFNSLPDTLKVKTLMQRNVTPDSLAVFVCEAGAGMRDGVSIKNFADVSTYVYMHSESKDFDLYTATFDAHAENLPLAAKMRLYSEIAKGDGNADQLGYKLGLEYVNSVMEKDMSIGAVDREIAEFKRACGKDDDTYRRFLKGFAVAISTRSAGELPADLVRKYGK